jgi:hypothetical protein
MQRLNYNAQCCIHNSLRPAKNVMRNLVVQIVSSLVSQSYEVIRKLLDGVGSLARLNGFRVMGYEKRLRRLDYYDAFLALSRLSSAFFLFECDSDPYRFIVHTFFP